MGGFFSRFDVGGARPPRAANGRRGLVTEPPPRPGSNFITKLVAYVAEQDWCFTSGSFIIDDPERKVYNMLMRQPGVEARMSTHLGHVQRAKRAPNGTPIYTTLNDSTRQYGFDIPALRLRCRRTGESVTIRTVLFFLVPTDGSRPDRLFLKLESWPCRGPYCLRGGAAGHGLSWLYTRVFKGHAKGRKEHGPAFNFDAAAAPPRYADVREQRERNYQRNRMAREVYLGQLDLATARPLDRKVRTNGAIKRNNAVNAAGKREAAGGNAAGKREAAANPNPNAAGKREAANTKLRTGAGVANSTNSTAKVTPNEFQKIERLFGL